MVRRSLYYFCKGLGAFAPDIAEVTARTVIIPGEQFCLLGLRLELVRVEEPSLGSGKWKTSAEKTGKTCCRELAPKLQPCTDNIP